MFFSPCKSYLFVMNRRGLERTPFSPNPGRGAVSPGCLTQLWRGWGPPAVWHCTLRLQAPSGPVSTSSLGGGGHRILLALLLQRLPLNSFFQAVFQSIPDIDGLRTEPN